MASLVDPLDDARRRLRAPTLLPQRLDLLGRVRSFWVDALKSQWPFYRDLPVTEGLVGENLRLLRSPRR